MTNKQFDTARARELFDRCGVKYYEKNYSDIQFNRMIKIFDMTLAHVDR